MQDKQGTQWLQKVIRIIHTMWEDTVVGLHAETIFQWHYSQNTSSAANTSFWIILFKD